jgi:hypothetical protein
MKEKLLELKAKGEEITKEMQVVHAEFVAKITVITKEIEDLGYKSVIQQDGSIFIYKDTRESIGELYAAPAPKQACTLSDC